MSTLQDTYSATLNIFKKCNLENSLDCVDYIFVSEPKSTPTKIHLVNCTFFHFLAHCMEYKVLN